MSDIFKSKNLTPIGEEYINNLKEVAKNLYEHYECIEERIPDKRRMALAKTNLEQSVMWAVKAVSNMEE